MCIQLLSRPRPPVLRNNNFHSLGETRKFTMIVRDENVLHGVFACLALDKLTRFFMVFHCPLLVCVGCIYMRSHVEPTCQACGKDRFFGMCVE